jgi:hypothetical protein
MDRILNEHRGRRLDYGQQEAKLAAQAEGLTFRGWFFGLVSCILLSAVVMYWDNILRQTATSLNLLAPQSVFLLLFFIVVFNMGLARLSGWFRLTRQDLALIFCMTILCNPLPGFGFMSYLLAAQMGPLYLASPENQWKDSVLPYLPAELTAHDPVDPASTDPRPVEWFYQGLPHIEEGVGGFWANFTAIPWGTLIGPYAWWCLALVFMLGLFFALSGLLHRTWSERERLPFPVIQVPEQMMDGFFPGALGSERKPFFLDRMALWGIGICFLLHSWNFLPNYVSKWPAIPLHIYHIDGTYLTEVPWRYMWPFPFKIIPSVIGFMYLVSIEVSFSMWFFFAVALKILQVIACGWFGVADNGWAFMWQRNGTQGCFFNIGVGALFAMVLAGFFMARSHLWQSLKQALGLEPQERDPLSLSPRVLWAVLAVCFLGGVGWLVYFRVSVAWAVFAVVVLTLISVGVARMVAEGGVMYIKCLSSPTDLMVATFSPAQIGSQNLVVTGMWGKVFEFDFYRMAPMITVMGALHTAALARMKPRWLLAGLSAALLLSFVVNFFSCHYTAYTHPGGATDLGWAFNSWPKGFYGEQAAWSREIKHWETLQKEREESGAAITAAEVPTVARTDWRRLSWLGVGATVMWLFLFARTRIFWWPHPLGIVLWMGFQGIYSMWFSYFLGWLIKLLLVRFGGQRQFLRWRRFFVGLIVGEALAVIFWIFFAWFMGKTGSVYSLEYN